MKFSIKEWKKMYDLVQELGQRLKDSLPTFDGTPPAIELTKDQQITLESKITSITQRIGKYLDQCGFRMPKPLWKYNREDKTTWSSHESFKYNHLREI